MSLGARIKEARLKKGLSLQQLAEKVGASKAHIWDLESNRAKNPTVALLKEISTHLEIPIADLVDENPNQGEEDSESIVMFRDLKSLDPEDRETIRLMMERLRKRPQKD